jgi:hypothetical protein
MERMTSFLDETAKYGGSSARVSVSGFAAFVSCIPLLNSAAARRLGFDLVVSVTNFLQAARFSNPQPWRKS